MSIETLIYSPRKNKKEQQRIKYIYGSKTPWFQVRCKDVKMILTYIVTLYRVEICIL
jgi:hypothetical protein